MPSRFQTMKCAASELLTHVDGVDLAARTPGRCAGRCARRPSAPRAWRCPDTSPRRPWRCARPPAGRRRCTRSTLPSFCAASISSGVTLVGAGAAANAGRPSSRQRKRGGGQALKDAAPRDVSPGHVAFPRSLACSLSCRQRTPGRGRRQLPRDRRRGAIRGYGGQIYPLPLGFLKQPTDSGRSNLGR